MEKIEKPKNWIPHDFADPTFRMECSSRNQSLAESDAYYSQEIAKKDEEINELVEALKEIENIGTISCKRIAKSALNKHKTINE